MMIGKINRRSIRHAEMVDCLYTVIPSIRIIEEYNVGDNLFLDIFLPDFSLAIEIDGEQHSKKIDFFHKDDLEFEEQKFRDRKKEKLCKENGITLFRVSSIDKRTPNEIISDIFSLVSKTRIDGVARFRCQKCHIRHTVCIDGVCGHCKVYEKSVTKIFNRKTK